MRFSVVREHLTNPGPNGQIKLQAFDMYGVTGDRPHPAPLALPTDRQICFVMMAPHIGFCCDDLALWPAAISVDRAFAAAFRGARLSLSSPASF